MKMATPKVVIVLSDKGHDPTETAVPWKAFKDAGFDVSFATERGQRPECDGKMLYGTTAKLLGAKKSVVKLYESMLTSPECLSPLSWTSPSFTLLPFNLVLFPGGHDKTVRQIIDSEDMHRLVLEYFPQTKRPSTKSVGAICHGVMVLSQSRRTNGEGDAGGKGKSAIHECVTTTLPGAFESGVFWATRLVLGDYYKTYGAGSENTEDSVRKALDNPSTQFKSNVGPAPFVVEDPKYNYISARFPGDAELFAQKLVEMVKAQPKSSS